MTSPTLIPAATLTAAGATCLNSLSHGGAALSVFIKGDDPARFYTLMETLFSDYQPATFQYAGFVTDAALARWFLWRRQRTAAANEARLFDEKPDQASWTAADLDRIAVFDRYCTHAERAMRRAFVNLDALRKQTVHEVHWQVALEQQKKRFALAEEKFRFAQERDARRGRKETAVDKLAAFEAERTYLERLQSAGARDLMRTNFFEGKPCVYQSFDVGLDPQTQRLVFSGRDSNIRVSKQIAEKSAGLYPPQVVVRTFTYQGPTALPDSSWIVQGTPESISSGARYHHLLSLEAFRRLAAAEDAAPVGEILNPFDFQDVTDA